MGSGGGRHVNYTLIVSEPPASPPAPPFWAEWRFASNLPATNDFNDDGGFSTGYFSVGTVLSMYGDSIFTFFGDKYVTGLDLNEFRTFRIEATNETDYCIWYDGILFTCDTGGQSNFGAAVLQMYGFGGDDPNFAWPLINRWDFVRCGRVTTDESIVASDPPGGILDAAEHSALDRFTVTFDQPNYVYVNDIVVDVQGTKARRHEGTEGDDPALALGVPVVIATRRQDNGPPETVEIVLERALTPADGTVRFTFNTGAATPQSIEYTLVDFVPCCLPSGACTELAKEDCQSQGGSPVSTACEGDQDEDTRDGSCGDSCPNDPSKLTPGQCGCGAPDTDTDSDTVVDCLDQCPGQDDLSDGNGNGTPDCLETPPIIPTASTWGLVVLALLLAITAKVQCRTRPFISP